MKINQKALENEGFTKKEMDTFIEIISYAKSCQESGDRSAMKAVVENKINEVTKDENL